uniref:Uncharacterized protein n=1 Tax=Graphocephala atropunctata TaxID=36148 RepID=A0A1B6MHZ4_9HEMI
MIKALLVFLFLKTTSSQNYNFLGNLVQNITSIYKNPQLCTSECLFHVVESYLAHLLDLETAIGNSTHGSLIGTQIGDKQKPEHLDKIPLAKISSVYEWGEPEVDRFMITVSKTRRTWHNILQALKGKRNSSIDHLDLNINYVQ